MLTACCPHDDDAARLVVFLPITAQYGTGKGSLWSESPLFRGSLFNKVKMNWTAELLRTQIDLNLCSVFGAVRMPAGHTCRCLLSSLQNLARKANSYPLDHDYPNTQ